MINSSPYKQSEAAVQIMTVFKAKGLEFEYVYLPACVDNVWGESSRGNSNKLTLPANLSPIRHAGATQDERLRIFFVAITRAKRGLYLTSYARNYAGKPTTRLQYLNEQSENGVDYQSMSLPVGKRQNVLSDQDPPALHSFISNWHDTHTRAVTNASLRDLLSTRLDKYQLSPTHLNSFFDLFYGGPEAFFFNTIMRFPAAPTASGQFGNSIHETLQWLQQELSQKGKLPDSKAAIKYFQIRMVNKKLSSSETKLLLERGEQALTAYYKQRHTMYRPGNIPEHSFRSEGVFVGEAQLAGKIDLLEIDKEAKTITVVDYKTGASYTKWSSDPKLHKYKQQLYCYKILIENSHSYKGYRVAGGRLEFVEPNADGRVGSLTLEFTSQEQDRTQALIEAAWHKIIALDFPDISKYPASMPGIKQFEDDLLAGTI